MFDTASNFLAALEDLLRYVAPGFVAVTLLLIAFPAVEFPTSIAVMGPAYLMIAGGIMAGVILNSCHVGMFEDPLCWLVLAACRRFAPGFTKEFQAASTSQMFQRLEEQREFRRTSSQERVKQFQRRHDRFGASLTFLYCSSYPGLGIALYQWVSPVPVNRAVLVTGLLFLLFALACDFSYTRRDLWAAGKFHEPHP